MGLLRQFFNRLSDNPPGGGRRHARLLGVSLVAAVLLAEGFALRDPFEPAPRDIDASVKRVQALALADSGFLRQALPYRARYLDPQQWYLPFVKPFVMRTRTGMQSIFPTVAAAVDVPAELLGGLAAVRLLSIVAVLVAVALTLKYLRIDSDVLAPSVLVFATPLWFYALGGSAHPVGLALATLAVWLALDPERAFAAGLLLGLSATMRDEALALAPGLAIVCAWRWRRLQPLTLLAVGVAVPLAVGGVLDAGLYGRPAAAHLLHAMQGTFFPDAPTGAMPTLKSLTWLERFDVVLVYWLDGRDRFHVASVAALAMLAAVVRGRTGSYWGAVPLMALVMVGAARDVVTMVETPRRLPGLLRLAPFLVFAVIPSPDSDQESSSRRRSALVVSAVFILIALLTTNTTGGKPLGPRLLLPVWPMLALVSWHRIRGHLSLARGTPVHRVLAAGGVLLVLAGVSLSTARLMPAYRSGEREALAATRYLAGTTDEVIVTGSPFAIDPVIAIYPKRTVMLASSNQDAAEIARRLAEGRVGRFLFVRRDDREDLAAEFPAFALGEESHFGRWIVQRWVR